MNRRIFTILYLLKSQNPSFHKFQQFINDCKKMQSDMEICNRKYNVTSTLVVKEYSSIQVLAQVLAEYSRQHYL